MVDPSVLFQSGGAMAVLAYLAYTNHRGRIASITDDVQQTKTYVHAQAVVTRAMARTDDDINTELVDEYLASNGIEPHDFIMPDGGERQRDEHS